MKGLPFILSLVPFGAFGCLAALQKDKEWIIVVYALALGLVLVALLQWLLIALNPVARKNNQLAAEALVQGLAFLLPFAVLALVADLALGWQSANAFFTAGLSTLAVTGGSLLVKQGEKQWSAVYVPLLVVMIAATGWMLLLARY